MNSSKIKTAYILANKSWQRGYSGQYSQNIRLGMQVAQNTCHYIAAKKHNGLWIGVWPMINQECKCGGNHFHFWHNQTEERNMFVYKCSKCRNETIAINSFEVATPDQPLGRWVKQGGKWFVKVISGDISAHDEIVIKSSKGVQTKKIKSVNILP